MKMELGAQTFTVRDYMQTTWDFREAMKRIAEIGYTCVQLSAVGNVPVQAQRDICDEFGLKIVLTHTNPDRMIADPEGVIRDHDILGCDYIGIGMMNPKYQRAEWIDQFAKDFTTPAKKMRDAGKLLMYHNHNLEWTRLRDGRRIMDVLLEQIRVLDKSRLGEYIGHLEAGRMKDVEYAMAVSLGLFDDSGIEEEFGREQVEYEQFLHM